MQSDEMTAVAVRGLLIAAAVRVIASHGMSGADARTIADEAGLELVDFRRTYPSVDALVEDTAAVLCSQPVFPEADTSAPVTSVASTIAFLAATHREFVDRFPERFGTIVQITAPALLGHPQLVTLLAARHRRARAVVRTHLWVHRTRGTVDPVLDLEGIASSLVDTFVGIETCFLLDGDPDLRDRAYAEAVAMFSVMLARSQT